MPIMSEEEKQAIHRMKRLLLYSKKNGYFSPFQEEEIDDMDIVLNLLEQQQKEIEEKTTILLAGAEKVKQLEKEIQRLEKDNDTLSELVIVNEDKVIKELDLISKDKIRELLKSKDIELTGVISYRELEELLEDK